MGTPSDCWHLKVDFEEKTNKKTDRFLIEDFFDLPQISKKFETVPMGYSGAGGKLIHEKNRRKKSRDTVPLRVIFPRKKCARRSRARSAAKTL
jgi:hypothetical protein